MSDSETTAGTMPDATAPILLFLVTEDWYFCSHRLPVARAARDAGFRVLVASRVRAHAEAIRAEGFEPIALSWRRGGPVWTLPLELFEIVRLYRRVNPDIVHHVALKPVVFGGIAARCVGLRGCVNAIAGLGFVFNSASFKARLLRPVLVALLRGLLGRKGQSVIVQNEDDAQVLATLGVPASHIHLIRGSGVDARRFAPSPEPAGEVTVTLVSRMLWDKGIGVFVEAARILRARQCPVRMQLVGSPDPDNPAAVPVSQLEAWHTEGVVNWLPQREDIPGIWRASHIGVLPSHYGEGVPMSLLEAGASGRALVATDAPGCREVVLEGQTGLCVPMRDPLALADAIGKLAMDEGLRRRLGAAARAHVELHFCEAVVVDKTLDLYRLIVRTARVGSLA